jgi:hypothetical protein
MNRQFIEQRASRCLDTMSAMNMDAGVFVNSLVKEREP